MFRTVHAFALHMYIQMNLKVNLGSIIRSLHILLKNLENANSGGTQMCIYVNRSSHIDNLLLCMYRTNMHVYMNIHIHEIN